MACILFKPEGGCLIPESDVQVSLSQMNNRTILSSEYEKKIDDTWRDRIKTNTTLFNGSKFRLHNTTNATTYNNKPSVKLQIGLTDYKDFLGTNYANSVDTDLLKAKGLDKYGNEHVHFANPLGVGALVLSVDDMFVLIRKSVLCGEAIGLLDVPGGHPEPEEIFGEPIKENQYFNPESGGEDDSTNEAIVHEIYQSILREVRDEINISMELLEQPLLIGIAGNSHSHNKPTAEFLIKTALDSKQISDLYKTGTQTESYESTELMFLNCSEVKCLEENPLWSEMTPSAQAALKLYKLHQDTNSMEANYACYE